MRLAAYVLMGDTRWVQQSILSYYHLVDRIVAIGDRRSRAWDGSPLAVDDCERILRTLDRDRKIVFYRPELVDIGMHPMELDTRARAAALARAREFAPWVLQIDLDEVVPRPQTLLTSLQKASHLGAQALDFPSRWFLGAVPGRPGVFLEACRANWGHSAHYPGPIAIGPGAELNYARRAFARTYRVDLRSRNTYPEYTADHPVHEVIAPKDAIIHLSWVFPGEGTPRLKREQYGHSLDFDMEAFATRRNWRLKHPNLTVLSTPLRFSHGHPNMLRFSRLRIDHEGADYG